MPGKSRVKWFVILLIVVLPAFALMLRPGIFTMHDFHTIRQLQIDKCAKELSIPCRWSPDVSFGYGQPAFLFYGQLPYWVGEIFRLSGMQIIDSTKMVFILSLVLAAFSMYLLARDTWSSKTAGIISALFYTYAPYRAVDVWVRGALNECLAFVFFPLILWATKKYLESAKNKYVIWLALALAGLLITHNLSLLMFAPFYGAWTIYYLIKTKAYRQIVGLVEAGLMALLLAGFYWLPLVAEKHLISLGKTTEGYFNYRLHYTSLKQLFVSNFWGYGGSTWGPNDTMSFAVGYFHSAIVAISVVLVIFSKKLRQNWTLVALLGLFTVVAWGLTHGKSEFMWNIVPGLTYVQFPWRFLSMGVLFSALLVGSLTLVTQSKLILSSSLVLLVLLNIGFFQPDIWRSITDKEQFSGKLWDEQISFAPADFWPAHAAKVPDRPQPTDPMILIGQATVTPLYKGAHKFTYDVEVYSEYAKIRFPIVYFPGWISKSSEIFPEGDYDLITTRLEQGQHKLELVFTNTWIRNVANLTSILAILFIIGWAYKYARK